MMKERILQGWTLIRVFYVVLGLAVVVESILSGQWPGVAFGAWFAAMGLFRLGCAAGNCYTGSRTPRTRRPGATDIDYTEIKN